MEKLELSKLKESTVAFIYKLIEEIPGINENNVLAFITNLVTHNFTMDDVAKYYNDHKERYTV